jgi:RNA polymerase sigma-70 factor, ECF subfamily
MNWGVRVAVPIPTMAMDHASPEDEIAIADSIGIAMLTVLGTLTPGERVAFVLHDMFAVPYDDIAPILGRSPDATRQLASRARRRVQGAQTDQKIDNARRREVVDAFLAAARGGDFQALLTLLDPEIVMRGDEAAARLGGRAQVRGSAAVAEFFKGGAQAARPALVDGRVGIAVVPAGKLLVVLQARDCWRPDRPYRRRGRYPRHGTVRSGTPGGLKPDHPRFGGME